MRKAAVVQCVKPCVTYNNRLIFQESIEQVDSNVARVQGFLVELLTVDRESEFQKIPQMTRCSHLDVVILFYDVSNPTQFERAHNKVFWRLSSVNGGEYRGEQNHYAKIALLLIFGAKILKYCAKTEKYL